MKYSPTDNALQRLPREIFQLPSRSIFDFVFRSKKAYNDIQLDSPRVNRFGRQSVDLPGRSSPPRFSASRKPITFAGDQKRGTRTKRATRLTPSLSLRLAFVSRSLLRSPRALSDLEPIPACAGSMKYDYSSIISGIIPRGAAGIS